MISCHRLTCLGHLGRLWDHSYFMLYPVGYFPICQQRNPFEATAPNISNLPPLSTSRTTWSYGSRFQSWLHLIKLFYAPTLLLVWRQFLLLLADSYCQAFRLSGPGKSTWPFSVTFRFPRRASRQGARGKWKSADVKWKTVTLIYPYPRLSSFDTSC